VRKLFRAIYYLGGSLLFLAIAIVGFTQTKTFRTYLHGILTDAVTTQLHGELRMGRLEGNLFTVLRVDSVQLSVAGRPVLQADRLEARYDLLSILVNRLSFQSVKLENPRVHLIRLVDGTWNIDQLFPSVPSDSIPSTTVVDFRRVQLVNAAVTMVDSVKLLGLARTPSEGAMAVTEYPTLMFLRLNLTASVRVSPRRVDATVQQCSAVLNEPFFVLSRLSGEFALTPTDVSLKRLRIETPASRLQIDAALKDVDLHSLSDAGELAGKQVLLTMNGERVSFAELRQLFPSAFGVLDQEVSVSAKVTGTVDRLNVENLVLQTPQSLVRVEGTVSNLHRLHDLEMDLICVNNRINPAELRRYIPKVPLPDVQTVGDLTYNLRFTGTPAAFKVRFEGSSTAGAVDVDGAATIRDGELSYNATMKTYGLNIGMIVNDEALRSRLFSTITLNGKGTDPFSMNAVLQASIDSSEFSGIPLQASTVLLSLADKALTSNITLRSGITNIGIAGTIQLHPNAPPQYTIEGTFSSLNLASILKSKHYESNLSFTLSMEGHGVNFRETRSTLQLTFLPSTFAGQRFTEAWARVELDATDPEKQFFRLTSPVADIDVEGKFQLDALVATLEKAGTFIAEGIAHRLNSLDALRGSSGLGTKPPFRSSLTHLPVPIDVRLGILVKDLYPLGVFLGHSIQGNGRITAEMSGSLDNLSFRSSTTMESFQYSDSTTALRLSNPMVTCTIDQLSRTTLLDSVSAVLSFSAAELSVNDRLLIQPSLYFTLQGPAAAYYIHALVDSVVRVGISGTSLAQHGFITYTLDKLKVDVQSYGFENAEPIVIRLGREGIEVERFVLRHEDEEVHVAGYFNPEGGSNLQINVAGFLLGNLQLFSVSKDFVHDVRELGGMVDGHVNFRGGLADPDINVDLLAKGVRYGSTVFGQVEARLAYARRILHLFAELRSKPGDRRIPPDLMIAGSLPYDFTLTQESRRKLEGEMDVTIRANDFRLEFIDPFIAELSNISGTLACDMNIRGTIDEPRYEGALSIQGGRFLLRPIGITYTIDGRFVPAGQRIALENVVVRNVPQDRPDGAMNISGSLTLQGLKLKEFDLLANGQLLVMKESARQPGQVIYGDLFAAAGSSGLRWRGSLQRSWVSGELIVKNANLTLPPTREQLMPASREVVITLVDDTTRTAPQGSNLSGAAKEESVEGSKPLALRTETPMVDTQQAQPASAIVPEGRSFLDRLVYDLDVEAQGPTHVRFIFNPYTGEELFAELKGRMAFTKDGDQTRLAGEVEVGERSYYNFLKRFQATGKLQFTGDPLNPELNILARYEGVYKTADTTALNGTARAVSTPTTNATFQPARVVVLLQITGTRKEPRPKFEIEEIDREGHHQKRTTGDVESDAIAFILTGSYRDDLTQQERSALLGTNLLYGLTSSVLSGPITDFVRKEFGFISSVDVIYYGGSFQSSTDVRLTGEVGEAVIRFGGRVFSDISNANWSVQLPMSSVLGSEKWRNLIIEAERRVEGVETYEQRRESNSVRLVYRITF
jgi:hypothetical protein